MRYTNVENTIVDTGNGKFVPVDENNSDWKRILEKKQDRFILPYEEVIEEPSITIEDLASKVEKLAARLDANEKA